MATTSIRRGAVALALLAAAPAANAGTITAVGAVSALTDISQLTNVLGTADFDAYPVNANLPLTAYSGAGLTFHEGPLTAILPGVTTGGSASAPYLWNIPGYFPAPIAGGGTQSGNYPIYAGVATFAPDLDVTQLGLTASSNGTQYLTAWDRSGVMLGSVTWEPLAFSDAAFVGIDTGGVAIGMIAYGNDNLWAGESYSIGGYTIMSDNWIWSGTRSAAPAPGSLLLLGLGAAALAMGRRRR